MTAIETTSPAARYPDVPFVTVDMFRDIHKAIRSELFEVTLAAGLHLDLAEFTARFLDHEDYEERRVAPAMEGAIGAEGVAAVQQALVSGIPPAQRASSLAIMLPALNVDDRAEVLGGVRAEEPAEVFAGVWALVESVLTPVQVRELADALGL